MEGPRPPNPKEHTQVIQFLNTQLRPQAEWSIDNEYPTALHFSNSHNMRIIVENEKIVSHAVIKPLIVKTPLLVYKVAAIGSVVTDVESRRQGLSRKIIENCIHEAKKQACEIALLWTDLYEFYRRFDFELAGFEHSFVIQKEFDYEIEGIQFIKGNQISAEAILKLYNQHSVTSHRTLDDIQKFLAIPQSRIYSAWSQEGQLLAYAVEGKGADLTGYIHEWGGSVSKLLALFSYIRKEKKAAFTVILPHHAINLWTALSRYTDLHNEGYLGMIKILNEEVFFQKIKKAARTLGLANLVLEKSDQEYLLGIGPHVCSYKSIKQLIPILFGPKSEFIGGIEDDASSQLNRIFPLPLWIWGWDSI